MYERILTRCLDTPLLISELKLGIITERVIIPIIMGIPVPTKLDAGTGVAVVGSRSAPSSNEVAVIEVFDTLFSKGGGGLSGSTTYESIGKQIDSAVRHGYKNIGFYVDSPGGEGFGLFGLMAKIQGLKAQGVRTFAFTDGMMTSAAYGVASATEVLYSAEAAISGSIAAIMTHVDMSQRDEQNGLKYTILRSKAEKALGDSHTPLSEEVKERLMANLAKFDSLFNNEVLKGRTDLTLQNILDMRGSEFMTAEAQSLGLIDHTVVSFQGAVDHFLSTKGKSKSNKVTATNARGMKMEEELQQVQAKLALAEAETKTLKAEMAAKIEAAVVEERERTVGILGAAKTLNMNGDLALRHIQSAYSLEQSLEIMKEIREGREKAIAIDGHSEGEGSNLAGSGAPTKTSLKTAFQKARGKAVA